MRQTPELGAIPYEHAGRRRRPLLCLDGGDPCLRHAWRLRLLELGTVRRKNHVNALVKILVDFAISTTVYFLVGYTIAYGVTFLVSASVLVGGAGYEAQGLTLVRFFFLATFAAAVPAIVSGGILAALIVGRNDPGFVHNGALAGLVAVCAGSDVMHPVGSFIVGAAAGIIFVKGFELCQYRLKIDDVLGVWPLHGRCGLWGGIACGIFGLEALGGLGGVSFAAQLSGSLAGAAYAFVAGAAVYSLVGATVGLRLSPEEERRGADLSIHRITSTPESDIG